MKLAQKNFSGAIFQLKGISKSSIENHLKLYQGYVNKYNEITEKISHLTETDYLNSNQVFSNIRELKMELSFAWGGIVNHEIYFSHLGGTTDKLPEGPLSAQIKKDFGSVEKFKQDLKATGLAARGWAWTIWNSREKKLYNHLGDSQNSFLLWETKPIIALDVYEHAYFMDFGVNRLAYIDAFFSNLNWKSIESSFDI